MSKNFERVKKWRLNTKLRMIDAFGGKCGICGYDRCAEALEFHHLDPTQKEFGLGAVVGKTANWSKFVVELRKCIMVCANCHREIHKGLIKIPDDITRFNEQYAEAYVQKVGKSIIVDNCPICGQLKPIKYKTCSHECASKVPKKVDWSIHDVVKLIEQYGNYSRVGDVLGVTGSAVKRRYLQVTNKLH